ncbi:MAG: helix-turn-helix domain-containing protein [Hyphomicrobiaceae bacterium]
MPSYRQHSSFADPREVGRPLDRETRHKIIWLAERLELRTKAKGRQSGCLGQTGLHVLRILLSFVGKDGACYPAIATLCQRTGFCRATVVAAIKRLEAAKLVEKTRRIIRAQVQRVNGWTGLVESIVTTVQTSNAYRVIAGAALRPSSELPAVGREFRAAGDLKRLQRLTGIALQVGTNRVHSVDCRDPQAIKRGA